MKPEQITNILWWNPRHFSQNDVVHYCVRHKLTGDIGLGYNPSGITWAKTPAPIFTNEYLASDVKEPNFIIDCPEHRIHIERAVVSSQHPYRSRVLKIPHQHLWRAEAGRYFGRFYISLRIMGYLVDCWTCLGGGEIRNGFIAFDSQPTAIKVPMPIYRIDRTTDITQNREVAPCIVGEFPRCHHEPGNYTMFKLFSPNFTNTTKMERMIDSFLEHPRNFFLQFIR